MTKQFKLNGVTWKVKNDSRRLDDLGLMGLCEYSKALISINDNLASIEMIEQTFYHELVHAILNDIGRNDLSQDEVLVQSFGALLHQFMLTKKDNNDSSRQNKR